MSKEQGGFISNIFLVPKDEERWRLILNLKSLNEFVAFEHFKMEDIRCVKDLLSRGDHMCKLDLKDVYLSIPIHGSCRRFLRFRWRGILYEYTALPFGLSAAPRFNLYKGLETSPSSIKGCRDMPSSILGQFSHSWRDQGRGRSSISEDQEPIAESGICDKPGEISEPGNPKNRISGVCHRFKRDGVQASSEKSEADQERMQEDSAERPGDCEGAGTSSGCPSSFSPGSFTSSAALSGTSGPEKRRSSPPPLIWINSGLECKEPRESEVVNQTPQQSEWPAHSSSTSHHDHRIRCIQYSMGSPLWISQDQGSVVNYRGQIAHQLQRDVSSFPGLTDICEGQEGDTCPVQGRQHHNNVLYQSHGRHTLPADDAVDIRRGIGA